MFVVLFLLLISFLVIRFCTSNIDTIFLNQSIRDSHVDRLVSSGKSFPPGFFSPRNSHKRYIGIWYNKISEKTVVWVANRDNPINDTSGILSIDKTGNLVIHNGNDSIPFWSTNVSVAAPANPCSAQLLDSGNLILLHKSVVAWQGFDHPTDSMLPLMKIGVDRRTGLNRFLTAWKSPDDPGAGEYMFKMDLNGSPQLFLSKGSVRLWRNGPWNGVKWSGIPLQTPNLVFRTTYVDNDDEVFIIGSNESVLSRFVMNESGTVEVLNWLEGDCRWVGYWSAPKDRCDPFGPYGTCGLFGNCNPPSDGKFECTCLPGFEPKVASDWSLWDASGGCVRKRGGDTCQNGEGFMPLTHSNIPYATMTGEYKFKFERVRAGVLERLFL